MLFFYPKLWKPVILLGLLMGVYSPKFTNAQEIPDPVIEECHSADDASELADCLKEGAVAFELLQLSVTTEYFGPAAQPVVDICREQNDSFNATWVCLRVASESAVETRSLIGTEKMQDTCMVAISEEAALSSLQEYQNQRRRELFPSGSIYGGTSYSPFKGCPIEKADNEEGAQQPMPSGQPDNEEFFTGKVCEAIDAVDEMIASSEGDDLVAQWIELEDQSVDNLVDVVGVFGLPKSVGQTFEDMPVEDRQTLPFLAGGIIERHHPGMVVELLKSSDEKVSGYEDIDALATDIVVGILTEADESFREACK